MFTATARAEGVEITAVDPVYSTAPRTLTAPLDAGTRDARARVE
jgi:hypothetical protein